MGRTQGGAFGVISGKVANAVGSSWKGIATVRSLPESVANPRTTAQTTQRNKFAQTVAVARLLLAMLIHVYWDPFTKKMSGYNAFIKSNIDAFDEDGLATPADFVAAKGTLLGETIGAITADVSDDRLDMVMTNHSGTGDALATDIPNVLVYNETKDIWQFDSGGSGFTRGDAAAELVSPNIAEGDTLHIWVFYQRPDVSKISDVDYATTTVEA